MSVLSYKPSYISFKYMCLIRKSDHMNLTNHINLQKKDIRKEGRKEEKSEKRQREFAELYTLLPTVIQENERKKKKIIIG